MLCLTCSNHFSILPFYVSIYFFYFYFYFFHILCVCVFFFFFFFFLNFISFLCVIYMHRTCFSFPIHIQLFYHISCTPSILCIYSTARLQIENKQTKQTNATKDKFARMLWIKFMDTFYYNIHYTCN